MMPLTDSIYLFDLLEYDTRVELARSCGLRLYS